MKHCDDYIDDEAQPRALRDFLRWARSPAHGMTAPRPHPRLYATLRGKRVRVTMASRFGDVGVTSQLERDHGYEERVHVEELTDFSAEASDQCVCSYVTVTVDYGCTGKERVVDRTCKLHGDGHSEKRVR